MMFRSSKHKSQRPPAGPSSSKVAIEDLLKFKRAERPDAEFWTNFDAQLKQRLLASAIQERRSWWHALPHYAIAIPAGAAAAFAIGFIVWRNALPHTPAPQTVTLVETRAQPPAAAPLQTNATSIVASGINAPSNTPAAILAASNQDAAKTPAPSALADEHPGTIRDILVSAPATPARNRALTRAAAPATTINTLALLGSRFIGAKTTTSTTLFPTPASITDDIPSLTTIALGTGAADIAATNEHTTRADETTSSSDPRRERLMAYYNDDIPAAASATAADNPRVTRLRDRMTSRINDKALTDTISRIDAIGDRVTIKF